MPPGESLLRRAARLPRADRPIAIEAAIMLALAFVAVRLCSRRWLHPTLRHVPSGGRSEAAVESGALLDLIERVANAHPLRPQCLEKALAGRWMLGRRGQPSTIVIGARQREFEAHAWLEIDGHVMPSVDVSQYTPIWRSEIGEKLHREIGEVKEHDKPCSVSDLPDLPVSSSSLTS